MRQYHVKLAAMAIVATLFLLTMGATVASADTFTYTLTLFNLCNANNVCSPSGTYPGPYGTAQVSTPTSDSNTATITFTAGQQSDKIYLFGGGGSVAVNVNAPKGSWTLGAITGSNTYNASYPGIFDPGNPYSDGGAGNEDGFKAFNQTINSFDGFGHSSTTISFTLTNTVGTWASAADVLTANSNGEAAAAHVFVWDGTFTTAQQCKHGSCTTTYTPNSALATGFAANGTVPEGGVTVMLLGGALFGLETLRRRFRA